MLSSGRRLLALSALMIGVLGSAPARAEDRKPDPLVLCYAVSNAGWWAFDVALDKGFFRDEGFAPETVPLQSSPQTIQLLIAEAVHIATVQPESMMSADLRGAELGAIAQAQVRPDWLFVVRPEIKSWSDLKGKTLGFSALRIAEFWLTQKLLASHGLAKGDWDAIQVGTSPAKLAALLKGSIAGTVLFQPLAQQSLRENLNSLGNYAALGNYPPTLIVTNRKWAAENQHGVRVSRAILRGHEWLYDPANHDEALAILGKFTKARPEIAEQIYQSFFVTDKLYSRDAAVDLKGVAKVAELMVGVGELPKDKVPRPEQLVIPKEAGGLWH